MSKFAIIYVLWQKTKGEKVMSDQKDLEYYMNLNYDMVLKVKNNRYYLFIEELSIIVEGDTFDDVYEKLHKEKEKNFNKVIESGAWQIVKEPKQVRARKKLFTGLLQFFVKVLIIAFILAFASNIIIGNIIGKLSLNVSELVSQSVNQVAKSSLQQIRTLNNRLNTLPEGRREEIRLRLRDKARQLKPFVDELRVLLEDDGTEEAEKNKSEP